MATFAHMEKEKMMNDRESLIALLDEARAKRREICYAHTDCNSCVFGEDGENCGDAMIADHLIANGVVLREKGEWIKQELTGCEPFYLCSVCEKIHDEDYNFCNNCGADMRKGENG